MRRYPDKQCTICGTTHNRRGVTCSNACAAVSRRNNSSIVKQCEYCRKDFKATHSFDRFCNEPHTARCKNCGTEFILTDVRRPSATCSASCASAIGHTAESNEARKANSLKKWGVEFPFQAEAVKAKITASPSHTQTRYGSEGFKKLMLERYGVENPFLLPNAVPGRISSINKRWKELLDEATGLSWRLEEPVAGVRTVDLYVEHRGKKLALEPHPTPTHNSYKHLIACNRRGCTEFPCEHAKSKFYHQDRSRALHEQGIQLISVFDWMPSDRVLAFVRSALQLNENRVYARNCEVRPITQKEANRFLNEFHMLGGSRKQEHCYGLYFQNELIQVQTFARRQRDWEARRLATRDNWQVIGGVSKGTKRFIADVQPDKIVAFSDLSLSWPDFDSRFNEFVERKIQPPVLCWSKGDKMILDKSAARMGADRLLRIAANSSESPYSPELTNADVFLAEGWLPVWDCGKIKEVRVF